MGEVFLVYDPVCDRRIALKKVRTNVKNPNRLKQCFLREAKIASRLVHPGVIPIYSICEDLDNTYYTMPYVEGRSLKEVFKQVWGQNFETCKKENGEYSSISELTRIFYSICHTMEYAHSKGVLHRDLKPDNILIGLYGEVIILDWGVATFISSDESFSDGTCFYGEKTLLGKIAGTPNYMPPERLRGNLANEQGDIYALGVVLYQMLALQFPFHRTVKSVRQFRDPLYTEFFLSPEEVAPYRDIPMELSKIAMKALAPNPLDRYKSVKEIIADISSYMEGNPVWSFKTKLLIDQPDCWEIRENVLFTGHLAITGMNNHFNWLGMAISKDFFSEDIKLETYLDPSSLISGVGFLFSVPEKEERKHLSEGYCLWLQSEENCLQVYLFKNSIEIIRSGKIFLDDSIQYYPVIEKRHNKLSFYMDGRLLLTYISHLPDIGGHIGLLFREPELINREINIFESSHNLYVSCLAVPNAFLANKNYDKALSLYKRISVSFPGRMESREAMFCAGLTLLEKGKHSQCPRIFDKSCAEALEIFSLLHTVSGGPLEYLGKTIVYQMTGEIEEEVKCLELGIRRYSEHPLVSRLKEHLVYRLYESAEYDRKSAYFFLLTVLKLGLEQSEGCFDLFTDLTRHWEIPPLDVNDKYFTALGLTYWLSSGNGLSYYFNVVLKDQDLTGFRDVMYAIYDLGYDPNILLRGSVLFDYKGTEYDNLICNCRSFLDALDFMTSGSFQEAEKILKEENFSEADLVRLISFFTDRLWISGSDYPLEILLEFLYSKFQPSTFKSKILPKIITIQLLRKNYDSLLKLFDSYAPEELVNDFSEIFTLYGCWLAMTEGEESAIIHFSGITDKIFPKSFVLLAYSLSRDPGFSEEKLFVKEQQTLYMHQHLYYSCLDYTDKAREALLKLQNLRRNF